MRPQLAHGIYQLFPLSISLPISFSLSLFLFFSATFASSWSQPPSFLDRSLEPNLVPFRLTILIPFLFLSAPLFCSSFFFSYLPSLSLTLSPFILLSLPLSLSLSRKQVNIFQPKPFFPKLFGSFSLSHPSLGPNQAGSSNPLREMASSSNCILIKLATLMDVRRVKKVKK